MVHSVWRAVIVLFKGAAVLVAILGTLALAVVIWFTLNPPFATPKTGELHASASRDLRLEPGQATLAIGLEARLNGNALRLDRGRAGPPEVRATITPVDGLSLEGVHFRLAPGDDAALGDVREMGGGRLDWTMPCAGEVGQGCVQRVILVVEAPPSAIERKWRLTVDGDLQYPALVPTPGWSSFDLAFRALGNEAGVGPSPLSEAGGVEELAMERPVVVVPMHIERGGVPEAGAGPPQAALRLSVDASRLTETAPAGLDAPPPVRATMLTADGMVVARQGIRPGGESRLLSMPLPGCSASCATDYWLAFEWMDRRQDAELQVTWRVEVIGLPADGRSAVSVSMRADAAQAPDLAGMASTPMADRDPLRGSHISLRIAGLPANGPEMNPVHVQLLVTATVDPASGAERRSQGILLAPFEGSGGPGVSFSVDPGETGSFIVNLEDGCTAGRCDEWRLEAYPESSVVASMGTPLGVTWQLQARAWRLVPGRDPIDVSLELL